VTPSPVGGRVSPEIGQEDGFARAERRKYRRLMDNGGDANDTPQCPAGDAAFERRCRVSAVGTRDAWLALLPEMVAVCNEAARRAQIRRDPTAVTYAEPLSSDYLYERVALAPSPPRGYACRERGGQRRLQGFILVTEFATFSRSLRFDGAHAAATFGTYSECAGSGGGGDAPSRKSAARPKATASAAEIVRSADAVALASLRPRRRGSSTARARSRRSSTKSRARRDPRASRRSATLWRSGPRSSRSRCWGASGAARAS